MSSKEGTSSGKSGKSSKSSSASKTPAQSSSSKLKDGHKSSSSSKHKDKDYAKEKSRDKDRDNKDKDRKHKDRDRDGKSKDSHRQSQKLKEYVSPSIKEESPVDPKLLEMNQKIDKVLEDTETGKEDIQILDKDGKSCTLHIAAAKNNIEDLKDAIAAGEIDLLLLHTNVLLRIIILTF